MLDCHLVGLLVALNFLGQLFGEDLSLLNLISVDHFDLFLSGLSFEESKDICVLGLVSRDRNVMCYSFHKLLRLPSAISLIVLLYFSIKPNVVLDCRSIDFPMVIMEDHSFVEMVLNLLLVNNLSVCSIVKPQAICDGRKIVSCNRFYHASCLTASSTVASLEIHFFLSLLLQVASQFE